MRKYILCFLIMCLLSFTSCMKHDFDDDMDRQIRDNVENVFGVQFDKNHDWCTTVNSQITVIPNADKSISKVQILITNQEDSTYSIKLLNEAQISDNNNVTISFDTPINHTDMLAAFIDNDGAYYYKKFKLGDNEVYFNDVTRALTRTLSPDFQVPTNTPTVTGTVETFANQRGWLPGEVFYETNYTSLSASDYDDNFKAIFRAIIFNYFPNGRKYDNLPQIKKSGYYNESVYPITTGEEPIVISPVYKNDGGYHEISEADIYYYYYKGDNLTTEEIEALPKYKAIQLGDIYANNYNDKIAKTNSYVLAYYGDGIPSVGTTGSYQFPAGYKIGFCYKSNTTYEKPKKQGEVYGDGRLNYNINNWGNFKSSGLGDTDPRMAWMSVNEKMFLCVESGTDKDFNDLIIEVEGGIKPIIIIPDEPEYNFYTFLFEDHNLGDYDMNDVVIKGRRIDDTHVEYTLLACGAYDEIYIHNVEGTKIKSNVEVHELFGKTQRTFVNTERGDNTPVIVDKITVNKNFSFLDASTQPYIYDKTINNTVKIAQVGQDPHAIMVPDDFRWPLEKICIRYAYSAFNSWGANKIVSTDWYKFPEVEKVF